MWGTVMHCCYLPSARAINDMHTDSYATFLGTSFFFLLLAIYSGNGINSIKDYFHRSGDFDWFLSLSAANITLGTGVVYYLSSSGRFGWLMFLSPLMVLVGYLTFAGLLKKRPRLQNDSSGNFLKWIDYQAATITGQTVRSSRLPTLSLVLTFLLILAFEIYASSTVFAQVLFTAPTSESIILIAFVLGSITMIYTLWGGVVGVLKTDRIQIVGAIAVIALLVAATLDNSYASPTANPITLWQFPTETFWPITAAVCGALATQFYSLLNWGAVSNFPEGHDASWTLNATGILTWILLSALVFVGLYASNGDAGASFKSLVDASFLSSNRLLALLLVAGMVCIVLSTADSLVIQITMFVYDNLLDKNSMDGTHNPAGVRNLRLLAIGGFAFVLSVVIVFIQTRQDLLFLLFAVAGGVVVYAPFLFLALWLSDNARALAVLTGRVPALFFLLFVISFGAHIYALVTAPTATAIVVVVSFFISCVVALGTYYLARSRSQT